MNYEEIIEELEIEKVESILNKLDIPFEDKGKFLIMPTYCHNHKSEEASRKLYFYKDTKLFVCYTEDGNMSIFKFLKKYYESQQYEYDWYQDIYHLITGGKAPDGIQLPKYESLQKKYEVKKKEITLPIYPDGVLDCFIKKYPVEWLNDKITKEAMDKYNILFSISQNKIIIPHYNTSGGLIGIRGRALNTWEIDQCGKYAPVWIEGRCYSHPLSMNLYGLNLNYENIRRSGICYIFEAEKSCLQLEGYDTPNCGVAVCGSQFNKYSFNILMKVAQPQEVIICFDREEKRGEDKYFNKLYSMGEKYKNYANFSFVYDRNGLTELKDSPTDRGETIFKKLIEKRVQIR